MEKIRLRKASWEYDPAIALGPHGGFGTVLLGRGEDGTEVAVKKLHISAGSAGYREFAISEELEGKTFSHIIPFYDSGIDAETMGYFVVMAKAERSLQQLIEKGTVSENDSVKILTDIARALREAEEIIHRDLKPGNVLYHEGKWKLADFGIARFVEDSTSLNTLKECLSPLYAAPEQWRLERAAKATDVYAFGCIAFALLTGHPPFLSGDIHDLRNCHLNEDPPKLRASVKMQQLVSLCLRKNPKARPSIDSILKQLEGMFSPQNPPNSIIATVGAAVATEEAKKEAEILRKKTEKKEREELAGDAIKSLGSIIETMFETIEREAVLAQRLGQWAISLGNGQLRIEVPFPVLGKGFFSNAGKDIVCGALIIVEQKGMVNYRGRSANLWFGDFTNSEFRWWEISYFEWSGGGRIFQPFGISNISQLRDADYAASNSVHLVQHAATPKPIDGEYAEEFMKRWMTRLAEAAMQRLQKPRSLPER